MAWTGNFKDQIDDLAGTLTVTDDAAIQQWILDGCYDVLTKAIIKSGPEEVWKFVTKSGSVTTADTDVDEIRTIAGVVRNGVFATKGMWGLKAKYADANSIYAATSNSPIWYLDNDNLSISPAPTGGEPANYYYVPEYAITNWNTSTSSIDNYPSEYYYYAMLYGAIQVLSRRMLDSTTPTALPTLSITAVSPNVPTLTTITYTGPSTSDVSIAPTVSTTAYVLPSAGTAFASRLTDFSALAGFSVNATAPTAISAPSLVSSAVSTVALADITGSVPSYNSVVTAGTLGALASLAIDDLTITSVPPDAFTPQQVTYTPPTAAVAVAPSGIADIIDIDDAPVTSITGASSNQPTYSSATAPTFPTTAINNELTELNRLIDTEEDTELASAKGQEINMLIQDFQAELSLYQAELGDANAELGKDNTIYQALVQQATQNANATNSHAVQNMQKELQRAQSIVQTGSTEHATALQIEQANKANEQAKVMQDAIQTVQAIIADNTVKMQEWSQGLAHYQAEVSTEVQEYTNNLQKKTQLWQQTNTTILQEHSQKMQDALNVFNKENAQYQANVQAQMAKFQADAANATKDIDSKMQTDIQNYTFEMQKWQQELTQYQAEVNTEVQTFTQNLQLETQTWQTEQANAIQQYQMEVADNMKTADIANQAAIQQGQADLQVAIRDKDKQLERELQNATNEMGKIVQNNQSLLAKYQAEASVYQAKIQEEIQENTQNLQKFQADLQAEGTGYQWLQDQYGRLKTEYERAFAVAQPQA
jgi:hypothetical protein